MAAQRQTEWPTPLPRGRHAASRAVVWASQRERLLTAMADGVAEKGYARVAVADVIERAGVSRKAFYEQFANKEECFLAAYDAGASVLLATIDDAAAAAAPDWLAALRAGVAAYLETLAAHPTFARTFLIEVPGAGDEALARRTAVHERFAAQLKASHDALRVDVPELIDPPAHSFRATIGAVNELVIAQLLEHGAEHLPELIEAIVDIELTLLVRGHLSGRIHSG
jgi:AcrR family transcriptional regulator